MKKVLSLLIVFLILVSPSFATLSTLKSDINKSIVKIGSNASVQKDAIVKNIIAVNGNIDIAGTVEEDAISVGGNITLKNSSKVMGDVISFGGTVKKENNATVIGDIAEVDLGPLSNISSMITNKNLLLLGIFIHLLTLLALLALALTCVAIFQKYIGKVSYYAEKSPWKSLLWGFLTVVAMLPIILGLILTIVGILLVPMLIVILIAGAFFGFVAISQLVGKKILQALKTYNKPMIIETALGFLIITLISFIPVAGLIIKFGASLIGLGAVIATKFGTKK
ncbi:hypothetical protein A2526_01520 [candidate division WOR-1 bacterium RIFOXYD2_FULL_36_8]|uniref:DUF8173 domain-containing protein n=1 Tax=candidate division WOR-1 bacterium RIFOXYB2_FULL_36_35 TaxID=1802578 RepID=A0A1F4S1L9_UNCSA|nr:MAG: hypothetical protein A2230_05245 [candidate division WOR-1 bacterium RIFOXYA2_FULL_36_21]OGC14331.1 MAG: hypothetical protein A2290_08325 [candidate division WOR-1 bacterium RIFOXYB2_FULL_36_35]OGC19638.1 MAG: hypothetical protein A2282_02760 [candidate division WOR-1 bacterium RIFOXYA12_FULL_36_13]OGC40683.1 MAG: hypothetical protein A2526_01520 [candidate division WOR-1 bacterium RIFOXYD2_FULL_36_8]